MSNSVDGSYFDGDYFSRRRFDVFLRNFLKVHFRDFILRCSGFPQVPSVNVYDFQEGKGVRFMVNQDGREMLGNLALIFADLAKISDVFTLPQSNEEIAALAANFVKALSTGEPINLYTPLCPDWSMDSSGRYTFRSLSGGESFIAKKFFRRVPALLRVLAKHKIAYQGLLIFADWGIETEIDDKNTYGRKLTQEDIRMCFASSLAATDEHLLELQKSRELDVLFAPFKVVSMTEFFKESGFDLGLLDEQFRKYFLKEPDGVKLLKELVTVSAQVNRERMGHDDAQNRQMCLETLVDYATFGQALDSYGIIIACESQISSKAYNRPRSAGDKVPMIFVKGKARETGVNIL